MKQKVKDFTAGSVNLFIRLGESMMKKGALLLILTMACLSLSSGCETITAFKTGDLTKDDVKEIVNLGFRGPEIPPVKPPDPPREVKTGSSLLQKVKTADSWMQDNLW